MLYWTIKQLLHEMEPSNVLTVYYASLKTMKHWQNRSNLASVGLAGDLKTGNGVCRWVFFFFFRYIFNLKKSINVVLTVGSYLTLVPSDHIELVIWPPALSHHN